MHSQGIFALVALVTIFGGLIIYVLAEIIRSK